MFTRDHVFIAEVKNWNFWPRRCSLEADTPFVLDSCHLLWFKAFASVKCIVYIWFRISEPCRCLIRNQGSWGCWSVFAARDPAFPFFLLPVSSYLSFFLKLLLKLLVKTNKNPLLFSLDFNKYVIIIVHYYMWSSHLHAPEIPYADSYLFFHHIVSRVQCLFPSVSLLCLISLACRH